MGIILLQADGPRNKASLVSKETGLFRFKELVRLNAVELHCCQHRLEILIACVMPGMEKREIGNYSQLYN
ncbi:hypothetical protein MTYM_00759 [Methylococcales bacterium]|nr:hypothetical protein MTYM_00759 [Methylococcales bacterium]